MAAENKLEIATYRRITAKNGTDYRYNEKTGDVRFSVPGDHSFHYLTTVDSYESFRNLVSDEDV